VRRRWWVVKASALLRSGGDRRSGVAEENVGLWRSLVAVVNSVRFSVAGVELAEHHRAIVVARSRRGRAGHAPHDRHAESPSNPVTGVPCRDVRQGSRVKHRASSGFSLLDSSVNLT